MDTHTYFNGAQLAALRTRAGLSHTQLAAQAGVVESAIRAYEIGSAAPRAARLGLLADALDVSVAEFFSGRSAP